MKASGARFPRALAGKPLAGFRATPSRRITGLTGIITFPVGVDAHAPGVALPITMGRFQLRGTPSLVVIDRAGRIRLSAFGQIDELVVGATLARLIDEPRSELEASCDPDIGCPVSIQESNP